MGPPTAGDIQLMTCRGDELNVINADGVYFGWGCAEVLLFFQEFSSNTAPRSLPI